MNFGPLIGGNLAHVVNFFSEQRFPVTLNKIDFSQNFEILFPGRGLRYSYQIFSLTGLGRSRVMNIKIWPRPENLAKMGVKFLGVERFQLPGGKIVGVV